MTRGWERKRKTADLVNVLDPMDWVEEMQRDDAERAHLENIRRTNSALATHYPELYREHTEKLLAVTRSRRYRKLLDQYEYTNEFSYCFLGKFDDLDVIEAKMQRLLKKASSWPSDYEDRFDGRHLPRKGLAWTVVRKKPISYEENPLLLAEGNELWVAMETFYGRSAPKRSYVAALCNEEPVWP